MDSIVMDYMGKLLAQRAHFIRTFYANKQNVMDNRTRLIASAHQLANNNHPFFSNTDISGAIALLAQGVIAPHDQSCVLLHLYAIANENSQALLTALYQSNATSLQHLAPKLALCMNIDDNPLSIDHDEALLNNQLLVCYYRQQCSEIEQFAREHGYNLSPLTRLYLNVFTQQPSIDNLLLTDFIELVQLDSELFELYIVRLDEPTLLALVNQLSADKQQVTLLIKVMALSGYSRFIPFLARFLQDRTHALAAHHALRLLLGEQLDTMIPNAIQFNSDEAQRIEDLTYYGAKILHHWDTAFIASLGPQILSGVGMTDASLDKLLQTGSQAHRRVASIHKTRFAHENAVLPYYACPELVL